MLLGSIALPGTCVMVNVNLLAASCWPAPLAANLIIPTAGGKVASLIDKGYLAARSANRGLLASDQHILALLHTLQAR